MNNTFHRLKRQRDAGEIDGFTLIELLIVIVVLGILAAVVIFALVGITGNSAGAASQADGATVSTALAAFEAQNPSYGPSGTAVTPALLSGTTLGGPYIQSWPSNLPHYSFPIYNCKLLQVVTGDTWATGPVLTKNATYNGKLTAAFVALATGTGTTPALIPYAGPSSCQDVS